MNHDRKPTSDPSNGAAESEAAGESANSENPFEDLSEQASGGIIREFVDFLRYNKKWWLTPIIFLLLLVGTLIVLTSSGAAPFLYTFW